MAEFKVSDGLTTEISDFRKAGNAINEGYTATDTDGVGTLDTAKAYIAQQKKIHKLLKLYVSLVVKDAKDLDQMVTTAKELDAKLASGN